MVLMVEFLLILTLFALYWSDNRQIQLVTLTRLFELFLKAWRTDVRVTHDFQPTANQNILHSSRW